MAEVKKVEDRDTGSSDPEYVKRKTKDLPWWIENVEGWLTKETRKILQAYSGIPADKVLDHVTTVREKLWNLRAYPCTGVSAFLVPWLKYHMSSSTVIDHLKHTPNSEFLDVGAYVGHDLRYLYWQGIPQASLHGIDILPFWDLGSELFNDRQKFKSTNIIGDILDFSQDSEQAKTCDGKMDVVWSAALIHQFPLGEQVRACKRLFRFSNEKPGSLVVGCIVGTRGGEWTFGEGDMKAAGENKEGASAFKHNVASLEKLWKEVSKSVGMEEKVRVRVGWKAFEEYGCRDGRCEFMGEGVGVLEWEVRIL